MALKRRKERKPSMKRKLYLASGAIGATLLLSSVISILEYRRMSNYVSDLIASNIKSINVSQQLASMADEYNMQLLAAIGDNLYVTEDPTPGSIPVFDNDRFMEQCDTLRNTFAAPRTRHLVDTMVTYYSAYIHASLAASEVLASDFIDSREWYFGQLQPEYQKLRMEMETLTEAIYDELKANSENFQDSFYRSIMPGVVSVGAGLMLVILLLYFIMSYYVNPIYRISGGIADYRASGRRHGYTFDGDDQLAEINTGVAELIEENIELKRRVKALREERASQKELEQ